MTNNKDKNSWLPNTNKSMFPDTWKENLKKSLTEKMVLNETTPCEYKTPDTEPWCMCGQGTMEYGPCRDKDGNTIKNPRYAGVPPLGPTKDLQKDITQVNRNKT